MSLKVFSVGWNNNLPYNSIQPLMHILELSNDADALQPGYIATFRFLELHSFPFPRKFEVGTGAGSFDLVSAINSYADSIASEHGLMRDDYVHHGVDLRSTTDAVILAAVPDVLEVILRGFNLEPYLAEKIESLTCAKIEVFQRGQSINPTVPGALSQLSQTVNARSDIDEAHGLIKQGIQDFKRIRQVIDSFKEIQ